MHLVHKNSNVISLNTKMSSALTSSTIFLILILFTTCASHFSNSQLLSYNEKGEQIKGLPIDNNVDRKMGSKFIAKFSRYHHAYNQSSSSHKSNKPLAHNSDKGRKESRIQTVVIVAVFSIGSISVSIFCIVVFLVCKRLQRERTQPSNGTNKVSYYPDPSPKLFYFNLMAPNMDIESSCKHSPSLSTHVLFNESEPAYNPTHEEEPIKLVSENLSCSNEEILFKNSLPHSEASLPNNSIPKPTTLPLLAHPISSVSNGSVPKPPPLPLPPPIRPPFGNGRRCRQLPPLPSCQLQQNTPVGKDGTPLPKLKPLHWDKVRAAPNLSMVWDKIRSSSFEFDEQMIESLFGYNTRSSAKTEEAKISSSSPGKHILDDKRLQNITILLKALNATTDQVCEALIQGSGLGYQQLETLTKMEPTKEEKEKLSNYGGDAEELSSAEKFVKAILNIPFAFSRVQVMLYKETFEDEIVHLKNSFAILEEACIELRSSRLFFRLLEAVLKTGNHMDVGASRGGAKAFKLDTLLKLADVKGTNGKTTLLHFVVQEIIRAEGVAAVESNSKKNRTETTEEREESYKVVGLDIVSGLSTELCNVKKTASVDSDVLASTVTSLVEGMNQMKDLADDLSIGDRNQGFVNNMKSFLVHAERTIEGLKEEKDLVLVHVRDITEYYHGNVSKEEANPLQIFVIVRDFLGMLERVCKESRSMKAY